MQFFFFFFKADLGVKMTPCFRALAKYNFLFVGRDYSMLKISYTKVSPLKKKTCQSVLLNFPDHLDLRENNTFDLRENNTFDLRENNMLNFSPSHLPVHKNFINQIGCMVISRIEKNSLLKLTDKP